MKAMIWKEWRENITWAGLVLFTLSLPTVNYWWVSKMPRQSSTIVNALIDTAIIITFLAPLLAAILGILQVSTELRRDQWAFLVHRPVSRTIIFAGKTIAGLSLYTVATVIPLLIALSARGYGDGLTADDWTFFQSRLIHIVACAGFYFAGMLSTLRPARWYGSRVFGFAAAIICPILVMAAPQYWQGILLLTGFNLILGLAAWGSFMTTGTYERQPFAARVALGVTLYFGVLAILGVVAGFAFYSTLSLSGRDHLSSTDFVVPTIVVPPLALFGGYFNVYPEFMGVYVGPEEAEQMRPYLFCSVVVALLCAPFTFLVARRASLSKGAIMGWTAATLPLGLSGLLLLLALRGWPTLVPCPNCGKKRSVEREKCEHCGVKFPAPVPDETSIFEERVDEREMELLTHRA
jgi:hypothetical protein